MSCVPQLRREDRLTVIGQGPRYHFVPSNPWVAVGWREREDIEVDLDAVMRRKGIALSDRRAQGASIPSENRIELEDGRLVAYDYLVIATGPDLAFDEIPGLGPNGHTQSICHVDHAVKAKAAFEQFAKSPGPIVVGAVQGASCFGPAYEFAFILDTELRKRRHPRPRADDLRHAGALYRPSRPRRRRRHQGSARERDARTPHQMDHQCRVKKVEAGKMTVEEVG